MVELVIIHCISLPEGCFGTGFVDDLFRNALDCRADPSFGSLRDLRVSAHLFIERDGRLTQYVSLFDRAWHAGVSEFMGRARCNDFSVGIELEGTDRSSFTDAQYECLALALGAIRTRWPAIGAQRIVGHCDVAPGRKTDPGTEFDWARLRADLAGAEPTA